ncbi:MAG TPA: terminase small subunit [Mucilaginibacter sp.]
MKPLSHKFPAASQLTVLIDSYFLGFENKESKPQKDNIEKSDSPTITGLALHLGFNSRDEFDLYETKGRFASALKRARLRVEASYEKKLHNGSPTGAIFALKSLGWNEKPEIKTTTKVLTTLKVKIIESGPVPAANEKEVIL